MQDQQPEEENPRKTSQIQNEAVNFQNLFYINKSEIQKAFNEKLAEGETKITLMQAKELTQELETMLNKQFNGMEIEIDNEAEKHQQDGEYDFTLSFEEYYALLQIWAENEDTKEDNQNGVEFSQNLTIKSEQTMGQQGIYAQHNKMIIERFLSSHQRDVYNYFFEYSKVKEADQEPRIQCSDVPLVFRVSLYMDNIIMQLTKEDQEEFFNKPDSQKEMLLAVDNFLKDRNKEETLENYLFSFDDFIEFMQYFVTTQGTVFLRKWEDQDFEEGSSKIDAGQESPLELEIKQNIAKYEKLAEQTQSEAEKIVISNMLSSLYAELSKIQQVRRQQFQGKKRYPVKAPLTKEQKRHLNLQEIYGFYCKQQYVQAPVFSFDRIMHDSHSMNLSNFLLFCRHFKITNYNPNLSKKSLPNLFKKTSPNYKELNLEQFKQILEKVALIMYED